jgi:hypothetical protein
MEAVEIALLQPQASSIPKATVRRGALLAALFAFCVGIGVGATPLVSTAGAIASAALDRFTGADRIARPDLADSRIGATPRRPLSAEWRWSPPGVQLDGMIRDSN